MQIVVTLTSWPKRIKNASLILYMLCQHQTVRPDAVYLWLSVAEFPRKELDLPIELRAVCQRFGIHIIWIDSNEYCFKRWYVYPKHFNDLVIAIDDDIYLCDTAIETIRDYYMSHQTPQVLHYKNVGGTIEIHDGIKYVIGRLQSGSSVKNYFQGNCAFAPRSFPLDAFTPQMIALRQHICPKCDESWIHPFLIKNNIPITYFGGVNWKECESTRATAISNDLHLDLVTIDGMTFKKADLYKCVVLRELPEVYSAWKRIFPNYDINAIRVDTETILQAIIH